MHLHINQFATQKCHRTQIAINLPSLLVSSLPLQSSSASKDVKQLDMRHAALFAYPARDTRHAGGASLTECITASLPGCLAATAVSLPVCLHVFLPVCRSAMFACMSNSHFIEIDKYWLRTSVQSTLDRQRHSQETHTQDTFDMLNICNGNASSPDSALKAKPIWGRERREREL